jgi:hypothetical protein
MWPIHGRYVCSRCLREYPVEWEGSPKPGEYADPALRNAVPMHTTVTALQ